MADLEVILKSNEGCAVPIIAKEKVFSKGTKGWYFRERVLIDGESHHVQIIVSKK